MMEREATADRDPLLIDFKRWLKEYEHRPGELFSERTVTSYYRIVRRFFFHEDDIEAIVPEDKPEIAPEAEDEPDGAAADWHLDGPYVGAWTNRLVEGASHRRCVGRVEGYLPPEEADFLDKDGKPCALWRIRYVTGELEDELEDVEWHERARGVPSCCGVFTSLDGLVSISR